MSLMAAGIAAAAISAAASAAGTVGSSIANSKAIKAMEESMKRREAILNNWYNNEENKDALNTAPSVRALTQLNEIAKQNTRAAQGYNTVMGGSNAEVAAQKEANAKMTGEAMSGIAAAAQQHKDSVKDEYLKAQMGLDQDKANLQAKTYQNQAQSIQQAAQGVSDSAMSFFKAYAGAKK